MTVTVAGGSSNSMTTATAAEAAREGLHAVAAYRSLIHGRAASFR
jgi:1-aminocyclopropane-1-carboxylate deaminase/D-cysteine desulfhydrase-like pyridoxal-dependent ACC family enzyme